MASILFAWSIAKATGTTVSGCDLVLATLSPDLLKCDRLRVTGLELGLEKRNGNGNGNGNGNNAVEAHCYVG